MPNIGAGKEHIYFNSPEGTRNKLDRLRRRVAQILPPDEAKMWCRDNGTFLAFMIERFDGAMEVSDSSKAKELAEKEAEVRRSVEELNRLLAAANEEFVTLTINFRKEGGDARDLISLLRLSNTSGVRPKELVRIMEAGNVPGLAAQLSRLEERIRQRVEEMDRLNKAIAELQAAINELVRQGKELNREIDAKAAELDRARNAVAVSCAVARDVGLYVDWIRQACELTGAATVQEVLLTPALVMAGAVLEAAATAYGDKEITLMPGPRHPLPMQVTIREIARSLAPPEAYREQAKREVKTDA